MPSWDSIIGRLAGRRKIGVQLKVTNRGWPEMMEEFKKLAKDGKISSGAGVIDAGVGALVEHKSDLNNLEIALIHEYGATIQALSSQTIRENESEIGYLATIYFTPQTINVPERSFIRSTFDENYNKYDELISKVAKMVYDRKIHLEDACSRLARRMALDIKAKIEKGLQPPLSPETIRHKTTHDERPLIDEGKLLNAIVAVVMKGVGGTAIRETVSERVSQMGEGVE